MAQQTAKFSNDDQQPLWDIGVFPLSAKRQVIASQLRAILRKCPNPLGPYIADVRDDSKSGRIGKADVSAVESYLVDNFSKKDVIPVLRVLEDVIFVLNHSYQKSIPRPTRLDRLTKDPNLLPENLPGVQRRVTAWARAEAQWLAQNSKYGAHQDGANPIDWEMVIASAALRRGLLSVKRVVALARALADPRNHFGLSPMRGYADLGVLTGGDSEDVIRWYPDSRMLVLISRISPSKVKEVLKRCSRAEATASTRDRRIAQVIFDGIVAAFVRQGVDPMLLPRSLSDFVTTTAEYLRNELPSTLVDYALGRVRGPSLLPGSADRINNEPVVYTPPPQKCRTNEKCDEPPDIRGAYAPIESKEEPNWMLRLRSAFSKPDDKQTLQAIATIKRSKMTSPSGKQLCTLATKLLTGPAYSGNTWSYAGIKSCVLTVARRFAMQQKDTDPATYLKANFEERYKLVVDEAGNNSISPQGIRRTVAWALRQYHQHLVHKYHASRIDEDAALRVASGPDRADAHVVSVDEIFMALEYIDVSRNRRWKKLYRTVAKGQMVLDFLGSLRRTEGFGLMPSDLLPGPFCEVNVRANDNRGLKTDNAYRRVVLGALAHPFPELLIPVHELFQEAERLGTDLSGGISDDVIVPIIHEALRVATGTKVCHLHTLRHSAAHWMFLRLTIADLGLDHAKGLFPHLSKTSEWLRASGEFKSLLLHNGYEMNDNSWAVAATLGHSNPDLVTLRDYVHCLDSILSLFLEFRTKLGSPADPEQLRALSGLPRSTAFLWLPKAKERSDISTNCILQGDSQESGGSRPSPEHLFAMRVLTRRLGVAVHSQINHNSRPTSVAAFWPKDTYDILWMSYELGLTVERLATIFGLSQGDVGAILSRADSILRIQGYQSSFDQAPQSGMASGNGQAESPKVPRGPKVGIDSETFRFWAARIEAHVCRNRETAAAALGYMVSNMLPKTGQVVFIGAPQPDFMQFCLGIYDACGFHRDDLRAIACDGTKKSEPSRQWLQKRGLSWRITAMNQFGSQRMLQVDSPWVVVGPRVPGDASAPSPGHQADAIWFLIRMIAIRFSPSCTALEPGTLGNVH